MARQWLRWIALGLLLPAGSAWAAGRAQERPVAATDFTFNGITTDFSQRIDEMIGGKNSSVRAHMPGALTAEYEGLTIIAGLSRHGDYLTLDMVVHNLGDHAQVLSKAQIDCIDNNGRTLTPVDDFPGASELGLRSVYRGKDTQQSMDDLSLEEALNSNPETAATTDEDVPKPGVTTSDHDIGTATQETDAPHPARESTELTEATDAAEGLNSPATVQLDPDSSLAYWAYFAVGDQPLNYPLTAVVKVHGHEMLFKYQP